MSDFNSNGLKPPPPSYAESLYKSNMNRSHAHLHQRGKTTPSPMHISNISKGLRRRVASVDPSSASGDYPSQDQDDPQDHGDYSYQYETRRRTWVEVPPKSRYSTGSGSGSDDTGSDQGALRSGRLTEEEKALRKQVR